MPIHTRPFDPARDDFEKMYRFLQEDYAAKRDDFIWLFSRLGDWKYGLWHEQKYFPSFFRKPAPFDLVASVLQRRAAADGRWRLRWNQRNGAISVRLGDAFGSLGGGEDGFDGDVGVGPGGVVGRGELRFEVGEERVDVLVGEDLATLVVLAGRGRRDHEVGERDRDLGRSAAGPDRSG